MSIETSLFAPTLIDAMNRVIAIDDTIDIVHFQIALALIAVVVQHNMNRTILLWGDAEDGCMTGTCHLQLQMLLRKTNRIVMRMGDFF